MKCSEVQEQLIDHAHEELEGVRRVDVGRHLADCSECALEYCRLQADLRGIVEAHADVPRARVFHQLRRRVAQEVRPPWWARTERVLTRPIPAYGAMLAGLVPVGLWVASLLVRPGALPGSEPATGSPPEHAAPAAAITDYDATAMPVAHREML